MGLLLETNNQLTTDCAIMKRVCSCFDKRRKWNDKGSSIRQTFTRKAMVGLTRAKTTRGPANMGPAPATNIVEGSSRGSTIAELTKMVRSLKQEETKGALLKTDVSHLHKGACGVIALTT